MGGGYCLSPGRTPGRSAWSPWGLEAFPAGVGLTGVLPEPVTPAGITSSHRALCIWPRPRLMTAASTNAEPVTPRDLPLSTIASGCKVGRGVAASHRPWRCPSLCPPLAFSVPSATPTGSVPPQGPPRVLFPSPLLPVFLQPSLLLPPPIPLGWRLERLFRGPLRRKGRTCRWGGVPRAVDTWAFRGGLLFLAGPGAQE